MAKFSILLACVFQLFFHTLLFGQIFQFDDPNDWKRMAGNENIVTGSYQGAAPEYAWVFLKDRFDHLYLQTPKVQFIGTDKWEAPNVRGDQGIRYVVVIAVNKRGNKEIEQWVQVERFEGIPEEEVKTLKGYRQLAMASWEAEAPPPPPPPSGDKLLVADFESGKDPLNQGGALGFWASEDQPDIKWGYRKLHTNDEQHGRFSAYCQITPKPAGQGWSGGGLVILLKADGHLDLRGFTHLLLDLRVMPGSKLDETLIKLEDAKGGNRPERQIAALGNPFSTAWQPYRIPLTDLANKRVGDPNHWENVDLSSVTKIVLVTKADSKNEAKGEMIIDNLIFEK